MTLKIRVLVRFLAGVFLLGVITGKTSAGVLLSSPGVYDVAGTFQSYADGLIYLSVVEGTRSQHVVRIRSAKDPRIVPGVKLRARVIANCTGDPADMIFESGAPALTVLEGDADIYSGFWRFVAPLDDPPT